LKKVIVIVGPTAVGKSKLAVRLAKKIKGEIISADSMQAYKGMEILSQSPARVERRAVRHHLVNFLKPEEEYSAAAFSGLAGKKIQAIIRKGKSPILVGGSGLYVRALVDGIFPSKGKDEGLRRELGRLASEKGPSFLHKKLRRIDPAAAGKIHPNDLKRIIRALEICEVEKKTKTSLEETSKGIRDEYELGIFGLIMDRKKLYEKINDRVDSMFASGIIREVKRLLRRDLSITSRQALGIKQVGKYLDKGCALEEAKDILKRDTRKLAKRQLTWFRADKRITWIDIFKKGEKEVVREIASDDIRKDKSAPSDAHGVGVYRFCGRKRQSRGDNGYRRRGHKGRGIRGYRKAERL
jgi:tRNA dimethylallyltransferase